MLKLMLCLVCGFALGVTTLQLRQQELELRHLSADFQAKIEARQAKLWQQQWQIASYTAPNVIARTVGGTMELAPDSELPATVADWIGLNAEATTEVSTLR